MALSRGVRVSTSYQEQQLRLLGGILLGLLERPNRVIKLFSALLQRRQLDIRLHIVLFELQRRLHLLDSLGQLARTLGTLGSLEVAWNLGRDHFDDDELPAHL